MLSLERILSYLMIDHEPEPPHPIAPPAYWPTSGELCVEKLSSRYSPVILPNMFSFGRSVLIPYFRTDHVYSRILRSRFNLVNEWALVRALLVNHYKNKICLYNSYLVGRTGSGKSSLVLSLLRCIYTEGEISYDGILTDTVPIETLRSKITIIPQVVSI